MESRSDRLSSRGALRGPVWLATSSLLTGAATYVVLIVLARVLGVTGYADFAVFWAFMVTASFGVFLPLEQEIARRVARGPDEILAVLRPAIAVALAYAVVLVLVSALIWTKMLSQVKPDPAMAVALVLLCFGLAFQFCARGVLSGQARLHAYATVVGSDAILRLAAVAVLWWVGIRTAGGFAIAVAGTGIVAALMGWALISRHRTGRRRTSMFRANLFRTTAALIVGALGMQLLLNGGTFIARGFADASEVAFAGHLLATMTLARVPVFLLQSMQASYVARVARQSHAGQQAALRRTLTVLGVFVGSMALVTVLGAALVGPEIIGLVYGESFRLDRGTTVLVAVGVGAYIVASVSNDVTVALGSHGTIARSWVIGVASGAVPLVIGTGIVAKSTLPLILGATVAGVLLFIRISHVSRRIGA